MSEDLGATTAGGDGSDTDGVDSEWDIDPEAQSILDDMGSKRCDPKLGGRKLNRRPSSARNRISGNAFGLIARDVS